MADSDPYDPASDLAAIEAATASLIATVERLDPGSLGEPSLLPGWTRGHVLAHVARNADSIVNLLTWARTGVETRAYASDEARAADIEAGAGRGLDEQLADLRATSERVVAAVVAMPPDRWAASVRGRSGVTLTADKILWARWQEVEVHHVDLNLDYTPAHWGEEFTAHALASTVKGFAGRDDVRPMRLVATDVEWSRELGASADDAVTVEGPRTALLAWLIGRSSGDGLVVHPSGAALPDLPAWI
jgi:maleylpyruvate isomerase